MVRLRGYIRNQYLLDSKGRSLRKVRNDKRRLALLAEWKKALAVLPEVIRQYILGFLIYKCSNCIRDKMFFECDYQFRPTSSFWWFDNAVWKNHLKKCRKLHDSKCTSGLCYLNI